MGSPKRPKAEPIAAVPKQSSLDIQRAQFEAEDKLRNRRGFLASQFASAPNALG